MMNEPNVDTGDAELILHLGGSQYLQLRGQAAELGITAELLATQIIDSYLASKSPAPIEDLWSE